MPPIRSPKVSQADDFLRAKRQEIVEADIQKKRECNARAMLIVQRLVENPVDKEWFIDSLKFISQEHFQDIVEERAITRLCGYPLCLKSLTFVPKQQFHISLKLNKVYDITERKNFCSNVCYKASKYIKDQLLTSPLWLRDTEEIPKFQLIPVKTSGSAGDEVHLGHSTLKQEVEELKQKDDNETKFTSVSNVSMDALTKLAENIDTLEVQEKEKACAFENCTEGLREESAEVKSRDETMDNSKVENSSVNYHEELLNNRDIKKSRDNDEEKLFASPCSGVESVNQNTEIEVKAASGKIGDSLSENTVVHSVERDPGSSELSSTSSQSHQHKETVSQQVSQSKTEKQKKRKNEKRTSDVPKVIFSVFHVEKCLREWFTVDTMCLLLGAEHVKELVAEKGDSIKEHYKPLSEVSWDPKLRRKYESLCRKLDMLDMEDKIFDKNVTSNKKDLKPLPQYNILKEEVKQNEMKVRAYFQGKFQYAADEAVKKSAEKTDSVETPELLLPLVDLHAQNALRRRIVLDRLNRVLPDLLRTFGMMARDVSSDVRNIVDSFSLGADNITFKPAEWSLVGLIVIKMLSLQNPRLKACLDDDTVQKYITMMLLGFQLDGGYLERLMTWLIDVDHILNKI